MKRFLFSCTMILSFSLMLIFPQEVFSGASDGLLLWFQIVLPTLLPFMIISNLLIHTNSITYISRVLSPILKKFFAVSSNGCYTILTGFLCGYPMGAKTVSDLILTGRISKVEGTYLLSFCNNTSPMFLISYIVLQNFKKPTLVLPSILILYLAPVLCSFPFRIYYKKKSGSYFYRSTETSKPINFNFQILDNCIMNGFETITKIGGYIILFSILFALLKNTHFQHLLPLLEITNGVPLIIKNSPSFSYTYIYTMALASFGGLCSVAQTKSMIQETGIPIFPYIIEKLITALVTSLFAFLYLKFILHLR